jgi:hypothetical protein
MMKNIVKGNKFLELTGQTRTTTKKFLKALTVGKKTHNNKRVRSHAGTFVGIFKNWPSD